MSWRDKISETLAGLFPPSEPDPRIPPLEGNPWGPMPNPPGFLGEFERRARMREAAEMAPDPRIKGWRRPP